MSRVVVVGSLNVDLHLLLQRHITPGETLLASGGTFSPGNSIGTFRVNGDLTMALARLPVDGWLGVQADAHWAADGIAVGTATLFDSLGAFGSGMVTAVANPAAQIDFGSTAFKGMRF